MTTPAMLPLLLLAGVASGLQLTQPEDVCYERVGCFSMQSPWWSTMRPLPPPSSPQDVGTFFTLYTRAQAQGAVIPIDPEVNLAGLDFDPSRPTIFITHGFLSNSSTEWMVEMKDALLQKYDANVVLTDWGPGAAGSLEYLQAAANTRMVGAEMSRVLKYMIDNAGVDPANVQLIGHSLGAQISSYAAKSTPGIGKLTALDPAQPGFEGFSAEVHVDQNDATFVEVIHSDAKPTIPLLGFGMMGAYGDVDYYLNGGYNQPGCTLPADQAPVSSFTDVLSLPVSVIGNVVTCPHGRACEVYIEAIRLDDCTFWGHKASVIDNVLGGVTGGLSYARTTPNKECSLDTCSPLKAGNDKYPARGSFVIATTGEKSFCIPEEQSDSTMSRLMSGGQQSNKVADPDIRIRLFNHVKSLFG